MDAFYASVEQRDFPELRDKPIAVGGSEKRGVVMTASYEARKFGVKSAMPSAIAARKCGALIFVKPRFDVYKKVSRQIREIFLSYTKLVEPLSLDEAYLDVTKNKFNLDNASQIAREIKHKITEQTGLTASAGVSINKFLAKVASDYQKPNGLSIIMPHQVQAFIDELEISRFHGIGKVTAAKMRDLGIHKGADLKRYDEHRLIALFGKNGKYYYQIAHGIDHREVNPNRTRKSISHENTFDHDIEQPNELRDELRKIAQQVINWSQKNDTFGRTITLKVKFNDFNQITRSRTLNTYIRQSSELEDIAVELLNSVEDARPVRLSGLGLSNLNNQSNVGASQLPLDFDL